MTSDTRAAPLPRVGAVTPAADPTVVPDDRNLRGLGHLLDREWAWQAFCRRFGTPRQMPDRLRLQHFVYHPGASAVVGYVAERQWDNWVAEDQFTFELVAGRRERIFRYPYDPYLPGLLHMASALAAHELLPKYVSLHPHRLHVETVRYRPTSRAVLRHTARWRRRGIGDVTVYVRVLPPARLPQLLTAGDLAERSGFILPRLVGCWREGGIAWLAGIPGKTVRTLIREGNPPDPEQILDGLASLWSASAPGNAGQPLDMVGAFRQAQRVLSGVLPDGAEHPMLRQATEALVPFVEAWRPSAPAHNDFYDDQVIVTPNGRLAVVDFEEVGPGDPLVDVGNALAHMRWMVRFRDSPDAFDVYRRELRSTALRRFGWDERELALREAYVLFRLSTNPVGRLRGDWLQSVETGLTLVAEALDGAS